MLVSYLIRWQISTICLLITCDGVWFEYKRRVEEGPIDNHNHQLLLYPATSRLDCPLSQPPFYLFHRHHIYTSPTPTTGSTI
jgi:hypothetical protein